jgi:hypothetical protein
VRRSGPKNVVASVQARLVEPSRELGVEHQLTLGRIGGERLLYRLGNSEFAASLASSCSRLAAFALSSSFAHN